MTQNKIRNGFGLFMLSPEFRVLSPEFSIFMPPKAQVTLYTRPGCHLCEEAKQEMLEAGCADEYVLEEVNIETDPALKESYGWEIPLIFINGVKAFKYRLTAGEFKLKLRRLTRP